MAKESGQFWIGQFSSWWPRKYFVQRPYKENRPSCAFSKSQNIEYFDYDFVEISYLDERKSVRDFINGHSYSEEYIDWVCHQAKKITIENINVFVFNSGDSCFRNPKSDRGLGYKLWYLGEFEFENGIE